MPVITRRAFLVTAPAAFTTRAAQPLGLTVDREGVLLRNGIPCRAIGVNYFDVFCHLLKHPDDGGFRRDFQRLAQLGIPFVRFAANGFWPADNQLYRRDRKAYFQLLDRVVEAAGESGLGLIPTLFWNHATVPDLVGEPVSAWGNPRSRTHAFMRTYTREVITRYRGSPAIWAWEFGNEYNDQIDLPKHPRFRPTAEPALGTPASRSEKDDLTLPMLLTALEQFARTARRYDPHRVISSGNNVTRADADRIHNARQGPIDTRDAWTWMLLRQNAHFPLLSVHFYLSFGTFFSDYPAGGPGVIEAVQRIGYCARKPAFVGEFGPTADDRDSGNRQFLTLLQAIESAAVPLSAAWVFGPRSLRDGLDWTIYFDNENAWMLAEIAAANRRMQYGAT